MTTVLGSMQAPSRSPSSELVLWLILGLAVAIVVLLLVWSKYGRLKRIVATGLPHLSTDDVVRYFPALNSTFGA
jgi:hypothetical protein